MPESLFENAFGGTAAKKRDLFQEAFGPPQGKGKDKFTEAFGGQAKPGDLSTLEAEAEAVGAPTVPQDSPGLFRRALDLLSRPNYAVAGAAEELLSPQGGGLAAVPGRVASEIFSGIGNIKGQKEGFGQVLEQSGVGELGHFSDLLPALYNDTGEGFQFQRGGWADPTGRGAIGLGLDIAADPTTYLTAGVGKGAQIGGKTVSRRGAAVLAEEVGKATNDWAKAVKSVGGDATSATLRDLSIRTGKARVQAAIAAGATDLLDRGGIKWMGMRVAPSPLEAIAGSWVSRALAAKLSTTKAGQYALETTKWMKENVSDPLGTLFLKGYGIRGLHGAQGVIDDALNKKAFLVGAMAADIERSPLAKWAGMSSKKREAIFKPAIDAFQKGGIAAVPEEFKPAMEYLSQSFDQMYAEEVAAGLLQKDQHLPNYFAHYYDNTPEELAKVIVAQRGGMSPAGVVDNLLKMGRNAEERVYDDLAQAVETSTRLHGRDPRIPILKPIYDPVDVLQRRWEHSIQKRINREMVGDLSARFGPLPFDVNEVFSYAKPVEKLDAKEFSVIKSAIEGGKDVDKVAEVAKLSDTGKQAFFNQRFRNIGSREELNSVLAKYDSFKDYFPKQVGDPGFLAADGSHFIEFNAGKYTAELPETLAREVAGLADTTLRNPALRKILQGYDTVNNIWKGSVTWLFPAFHVRNAYSNVAQAFVDIGIGAVNPASYKQTAEILFGKGEGVFKTALGDYSYSEVRDILNRHGIKTSGDALAEFTGNQSKLLKPFKAARNVGTAIENESRAQLALNYLRRGMDPEEVGARVKKFQLDYANGLTNFERQWMKRVIPFYTFQRLNLGLQLDNMLKRPGGLLAEIKPFRGREDENAQMTSWDAGALKMRLNRDGKHVQMITGIDLPIRNLDLIFRGNLRDTMANAIGMLSPIAKTPIELAAGKSLFTGRDFERTNAPVAGRAIEHFPKSIQQWMGYKKDTDKAGRPRYSFDGERYYLLLQAGVTSRFLSTSDRLFKQYTQDADAGHLKMALDYLTGLRWQDMDMDEEMAKRKDERIRDLERALTRWGERKEFQRTFKPKGQ